MCRQPVEEPHGAEDLVAGVADRSALDGVVIGAASDAAQHPPGGEGGDGLAVLGATDGGNGLRVEPLKGEEPLVARSEDAVGHEHVANVVRRHRTGMGVERFVGQRHGSGRQLGEDGGAGSLTQPVQGFAWCCGGDDGVVHANQGRGHDAVRTGHRFGSSAGECASIAASPFIKLVFAPARRAGVHGGQSRAVTAAGGTGTRR